MKTSIFITVAMVALFIAASCTSDEKKEVVLQEEESPYTYESSAPENKAVKSADQKQTGTSDYISENAGTSENAGVYEGAETDSESRPYMVVKSVRVETVSDNLKDGFKVLVTLWKHSDEVKYLYKWTHNGSDLVSDPNQNRLAWSDSFKKGDDIKVEVTPYYEEEKSPWNYKGSIQVPNSPPEISSMSEGSFIDKNRYVYQVKAKDRDEGDELSYSLQDAPQGMSISDKGKITWQYGEDDVGDYSFTVSVSDGDGGETSQVLSLKIGKIQKQENGS